MSFQAKCRCQHCDQTIEFETVHAGEMVNCPNCGMETQLFIPPVSVRAMDAAVHGLSPAAHGRDIKEARKRMGSILGIIGLLTFLALLLSIATPKDEMDSPSWALAPIVLCASFLYFIPSFVALKKNNFVALFALNLLLGWTFLGWAGALIWALLKEKSDLETATPLATSNPPSVFPKK